MISLRNKLLVNFAGLCACVVAGSSLAQTSAPPVAATAPRPTNVSALTFPTGKCPVDTFRELLAMSDAERNQFLTNRSVVSQRLIQGKIKEYQKLSPEMRELRLRATELRWYLLPLMNGPTTNRTAQLAAIPEQVRPLVEDRLRLWDKLGPEDQKRLLSPAVESIANQAARMHEPSNRLAAAHVIVDLAQRQWLEKGIERWQEMNEEQRQEIARHINLFFDLKPQEKARALSTLSEPERQQLERTLASYGNLSAEKRAECLESFDKFANLSIEERQEFLENAQRWEKLSPTERQTWRDLVAAQITPRRPARFHLRLPPRPVSAMATNQN
jgi:hypothetical protein